MAEAPSCTYQEPDRTATRKCGQPGTEWWEDRAGRLIASRCDRHRNAKARMAAEGNGWTVRTA